MNPKTPYLLPFLCCFFLLYSCNGNGQTEDLTSNQKHQAIGTKVAEIDTCIFIIHQDQHLNYWYGGDGEGVFKFNGDSIVQYTTKDGLCGDRVREIKEDKAGNIYINTLNGVSKYDGNTFETLPFRENEDGWELKPNDMWFKGVPGSNGPCRYDGEVLHQLEFPKHYLADDFFRRHPNVSYSPYEVYTIYTDMRGDVWFGTSNFGLCRFDGDKLSWMYEKHLTDIADASFGIRSIIEDYNGLFWICNTNYRFDMLDSDSIADQTHFMQYNRLEGVGYLKENQETEFPYFMSATLDAEGDLWMATYNDGVYRYDYQELYHYPLMDGDQIITLFSIYKDREDNLWLGSHNAGALKFNGTNFEQFELE